MARPRLERSCRDWVRCEPAAGGLQRMQAWFAGSAFSRHRHDTYAIGLTDSGVQSFGYRGATHSSTPGEVVVLHPDEPHDGFAGTDAGFGYRILYADPAQLQEALRAVTGRYCALPFLRLPVVKSERLRGIVESGFDCAAEPLAIESILLRLAECLLSESGGHISKPRLDIVAIERARQLLDGAVERIVRSAELEAASGLPRFELARQFRARHGTSPYRYSLMRRLAFVRERLGSGRPMADLALEAAFADQAHFTRQFKRAFGLTPSRYARLKSSLR
jgi:AraC-like DNA-binding protein